MATKDISRSAFNPRKHYASVRMQQGRVIVDDDFNENERIENEDRRRARVDIIGPAGSPDDGFRIANPRKDSGSRVEFDITDGTFYLGGLRLEIEGSQTFRTQKDFLQTPIIAPRFPTHERIDLVVLETYQEPVVATEDSELFEVALGGPDTSARIRTTQHVQLLTDVHSLECHEAWKEFQERMAKAKIGTLSPENELISDETLTVSFGVGGAPDDLCTPSVAGGYLGAENQAVRVQLVDSNKFTWGFDNAAPLYRIRLAADRRTVTFLNEPKDAAHWPLAQQIVEVLPWGAVLPNGEKLAELAGHLSRVETSYNPDTRQLKIVTPVPTAGFDDWKSRPDAASIHSGDAYYYLRVWNRGSDTASDPAIAITGSPQALGQTGLLVNFGGADRVPGDYWIIAARPETPDRVVPWDFETGRRPHGVRRFIAPLAVIHWRYSGSAFIGADVYDCRPTFRPLTQQQTCCRFLVGDGVKSHGHFDSIEEALQHLPASGGVICLLPGTHKANAVIKNRHNIKISGCDRNSRVIPRENKRQQPIFSIIDSQAVILEHMDMVTFEGTAVLARASLPAGDSPPGDLREIEIANNRILAYLHAVRVKNGVEVSIHHNQILMLDKEGGKAAIYLQGEDALIERNSLNMIPQDVVPPKEETPGVEEEPDPTDPCADLEKIYTNWGYLYAYLQYVYRIDLTVFFPDAGFKGLGGIQVGSGSERVRVLENNIIGGAGNGITLGSDLELPEPEDTGVEAAEVFEVNNTTGVMLGSLRYNGKAVSNASVIFEAQDGSTRTVVTDADGNYVLKASPGRYSIYVSHPNYVVKTVQSREIGKEYGMYSYIEVAEVDQSSSLLEVLAFSYEISIEGNQISRMGLSGIGYPRLDPQLLASLGRRALKAVSQTQALIVLALVARVFGVLGGFVVDLAIVGNHISRCVQQYPTPEPGKRAPQGVGGISLSICDRVYIYENRIEFNGRNHLAPVSGVAILYGEQLTITDNIIRGNAPIDLAAGEDLLPGVRAGILIVMATSLSLLDVFSDTGAGWSAASYLTNLGMEARQTLATTGGHAARLHDNVVEQPLGQALAMVALGPVSVVNNAFSSDFSGFQLFDRLAGTVMIVDLGRPAFLQQSQLKSLGGLRLPSGNIMFNENQTILGRGQCYTSQLMLTMDDLEFIGNQSDVLAEQGMLVNTALLSITVRASHNRLKEPIGG